MNRICLAVAVVALALVWSLGSVRAEVSGPLVVSDRWPECTDMFTWAKDAFRLDGVQNSSERNRAISFYNWLRLFNRNCQNEGGMAHAFEGAWGQESFVHDINKHLFVYGWGYCATHSLVAEGFWQEYTHDSLAADRVILMHEGGGYHTMYRLKMDGYFGAFDARYSYYLLEKDTPDARILDWDGIGDDNNIYANLKFKNRARPFFEFPKAEFQRALWVKNKPVFKSENAWRAAGGEPEVVFRDRQYRMGTQFHDMRFRLPRGTTIERYWDNSMKKWYIPKNQKNMFFPEGRFYRVGASMVGADGEKNDPNWKYIKPYLTRVPVGQGYPADLEGDLSLGQAWGKISYRPDLSRGDLEEVKISGEGLVQADTAPFVRPAAANVESEWILQFYSPYILIDGFISGELMGGRSDKLEIAFRSQVAKPGNISQPDKWLPWNVLQARSGRFYVNLDRTDASEGNSSFHGSYLYQVRLHFTAAADPSSMGLKDLAIVCFFENGIMSIPQIFEGQNTIRFKVDDPAQVKSDIFVEYNWESPDNLFSHTQKITPDNFYKDKEAVYTIEAPSLARCKSLIISYP